MKRFEMISKVKLLFLVVFLSVAPIVVNAQTNFDENSDGDNVQDTPVNGGVALLLVAGIGFGAYKIYKVKTQEKLVKAI